MNQQSGDCDRMGGAGYSGVDGVAVRVTDPVIVPLPPWAAPVDRKV